MEVMRRSTSKQGIVRHTIRGLQGRKLPVRKHIHSCLFLVVETKAEGEIEKESLTLSHRLIGYFGHATKRL